MTDHTAADGRAAESVRRVATVRTAHADANVVAAALAPDHTDSMEADVDGDTITCTVQRPTTGGLRSTVDDYVVNLRIADRIVDCVNAVADAGSSESTEPEAETADAESAEFADREDCTDGAIDAEGADGAIDAEGADGAIDAEGADGAIDAEDAVPIEPSDATTTATNTSNSSGFNSNTSNTNT